MTRTAIVTVLLLAIGGCATERPPEIRAEVRDSAGVRIVMNGPFESLRRVRVHDAPAFRTGWADDEPTFEMIHSGALLPEGQVAVMDDQGKALYLLSPTGVVRRVVGRQGDGPGEFQSGDAVEALPDGRLLVHDYMGNRLSLFDPTGDFLDSELWTNIGMVGSTPDGVLSDGRLGWVSTSFSPTRAAQDVETHWVEGPLLTSSPLGEEVDTLVVLPMVEFRIRNGRPAPDPFMRYSVAAVYPEGFVWARNDTPEVQWLDASGSIRQRARWVDAPRRVDATVWAEYEEALAARAGNARERMSDERVAARLRETREAASATLPYFRSIHVDEVGAVWVSSYTMLGNPTDTFVVLGADGISQAVVELPRPMRLLDVRDGHVLGVEVDEWGVQAVVVYGVEL